MLVQYQHRQEITGLTTAITFPRPFADQPSVVATADTAGGQNVTVRDITTTGFNLVVSQMGGNIAVNWIAVGPSP